LKRDFLEDNLRAIEHLKQHLKVIGVVACYACYCEGNVYNAAAVLQNQKLAGTYHKVEPPNYGVFDEKRYFQKGSEYFVFDLNQIVLATTMCEDTWIERGVVEQSVQTNSIDIVSKISASPFHGGKIEIPLEVADRLAHRANAIVCFNNLDAGQEELVFDGGNLVMNPDASLMVRPKRFQGGIFDCGRTD